MYGGDGNYGDGSDDVTDGSGDDCDGLTKQAALLVLGLKEKYKLTQVAMQGIIEGMTTLMQVN